MATELAVFVPPPSLFVPAPSPPPIGPAELLEHWLAGRSPRTVRAYGSDLADFAAWFRAYSARDLTGPAAAIRELLALGPGAANAAVLGYRSSLESRGLASATIARRLAALRSLVELAKTLGMVAWDVGIKSPKVEARRDVRGPDRDDRRKIWKALRAPGDSPKARRDRALVALMFDLALRRSEVVSLDLADVLIVGATLMVRGKGRREKECLTLPPATREALDEWLEARGHHQGALFVRLDRAAGEAPDNRLTGDGVAGIIRGLGVAAGLARRLRPHGFRHAAITAALDAGNDIRQVRKFSRHSKLETVIRYDDARDDAAGKIARGVSRERK